MLVARRFFRPFVMPGSPADGGLCRLFASEYDGAGDTGQFQPVQPLYTIHRN